MWREFIRDLKLTAQYPIEIEFANGVNDGQIMALERELGITLPEDLKALLYESNGVSDQYGLGIVWPLEEIAQYNQEMRTLPHYQNFYMSFIDLLFFADAGNGDRFAFPIFQGVVQQAPVFAWDHEDDARRVIASSLKSYLEGWLCGEISV